MSTELELAGSHAVARHETDGAQMLAIIARAASDPNVNVDKMERLYAMLKEEKARVAEQQFSASMRQAQSEMPIIFKDATNPSTSSKYARLESLKKLAMPIITQNGFSLQFSQGDGAPAGQIRVQCLVCHEGGHSKTHHLDLAIDDVGAKGNASKTKIHGQGSTFSYGERYLTKLIFNITISGEDDDGNQGNKPKPKGPSSVQGEPTTRELAVELWNVLKPVRGPEKNWTAANRWLWDETVIADTEEAPNMTLERLRQAIEKAKVKLGGRQ